MNTTERFLAWLDMIEVSCWFIIMILIEMNIRLQDKGITEGPLIRAANYTKLFLYTTILCIGVYWALNDHLLYFWDELLWIGGFAAIEMNVSDWRDEIRSGSARLRGGAGEGL